MINNKDTNRIIGEFLEINSDIVKAEFDNEQLSNWYCLLKIWNRYHYERTRKKLLKMARNIPKLNIALNKYNLSELFVYMYNNFPPNGSYECIKSVSMNEDEYEYITSNIVFDSYSIAITIYSNNENKFELTATEKKPDSTYGTFHVELEDLSYQSSSKLNDIVLELNTELLKCISDYIVEVVSAYIKPKKEIRV